ncbi:hypothetical protein BGW41_006595 [Actinomortierella wolfii]|nr:hypothetical protein BGW41_006595 [Actinomortierella wolfii]
MTKEKHDDTEQPPVSIDCEEESPIEEVRVTIPNWDDPSLPCNTFRAWFLGIGFAAAIAYVNQFLYMRHTGVYVGHAVTALLSLPLGHLMARTLPTTRYSLFGFTFTLNPGPFSIKEHVVIGTMTSLNAFNAYAVDIVVLQKVFYHSEKPFIAGLLLVWTTQIAGFSLAGLLQRILVKPANMVWPSNLVAAALYRSLHHVRESSADTTRMSRMKYFGLVTLGSFIWFFFPGFVFPTLSAISWICWIKPDNIVLAQLAGTSGLGIGTIALDWSVINSLIWPMVNPWFAQVNVLIGFVIVAYVVAPWVYYTNLWDSKNYPILSDGLFLPNGASYDVRAVMTDGKFDREKYLAYGPMRISSMFAIAYGIGFAGLCATVVHVALYHGEDIVKRWRNSREEHEDIHCRLMKAYPEVPNWWYALLFVIVIALTFVTCVVWDYMPWWAVFLALAVVAIFVLPIGVTSAVTNVQPGLNIITEYIFGYLKPGYPMENVTFKTYGYNVTIQALHFSFDMKLGHYLKIPPRTMFMAQLVSTIVCSTFNLATAVWVVDSYPNACTRKGYPYTCRSTNTFYSASIIWGAIAPARFFGSVDGGIYSYAQYGFLFGALIPIPFWLLARRYPHIQWLQLIHWPVLLSVTSNMPPALPHMYTNALFWGFIFSYLIRRYRFKWWARYNYLTSAALDTGVALSAIFIFLVFQLPGNIKMPHWWGNPNFDIDWENASFEEKNAASIDHCYHGYSNYYGHQN